MPIPGMGPARTGNYTSAARSDESEDENGWDTFGPEHIEVNPPDLCDLDLEIEPRTRWNFSAMNAVDEEKSYSLELARIAILSGRNEEVIQLLEDKKVNVGDVIGNEGWSLLTHAAFTANYGLMLKLLQNEANVSHKGTDSFTPLLALVTSQKLPDDDSLQKLLILLFEHGADLNVVDLRLITPLHFAVKRNHFLFADTFIKREADVNALDMFGRTPLHYAALGGHLSMVGLLLEGGADLSIVDKDGVKPYELALLNGHLNISTVLYKAEQSNWRPGKGIKVDELICDCASIKKPDTKVVNESEGYKRLVAILKQNGLEKHIPIIEKHNIDLCAFLKLTEDKLKVIGIAEVGDRLKMVDMIRMAHNQDWQKESLPSLHDKTKISMTEASFILLNSNEHLMYMSTTMVYLQQQIRADSRALVAGAETDKSKVSELSRFAQSAIAAVDELKEETLILGSFLKQLDGRVEYSTADLVKFNKKSGRTVYWSLLALLGVACFSTIKFKFGIGKLVRRLFGGHFSWKRG